MDLFDMFNVPVEVISVPKPVRIPKTKTQITEEEELAIKRQNRNQVKFTDDQFLDVATLVSSRIKMRYVLAYTRELITRFNRAVWSAHLTNTFSEAELPTISIDHLGLYFKYADIGYEVRMYFRINTSDYIRVVIFNDNETDYTGNEKLIFDNEYTNPYEY